MRTRQRRGMLLLVVLALLAMFAMMTVAFVVMTSFHRDSAQKIAQVENQFDSPDKLLNDAVKVVVNRFGDQFWHGGHHVGNYMAKPSGEDLRFRNDRHRELSLYAQFRHRGRQRPVDRIHPAANQPGKIRQFGHGRLRTEQARRSIPLRRLCADDAGRAGRRVEHADRGHQSEHAELADGGIRGRRMATRAKLGRALHHQRVSLLGHGIWVHQQRREHDVDGPSAKCAAFDLAVVGRDEWHYCRRSEQRLHSARLPGSALGPSRARRRRRSFCAHSVPATVGFDRLLGQKLGNQPVLGFRSKRRPSSSRSRFDPWERSWRPILRIPYLRAATSIWPQVPPATAGPGTATCSITQTDTNGTWTTWAAAGRTACGSTWECRSAIHPTARRTSRCSPFSASTWTDG